MSVMNNDLDASFLNGIVQFWCLWCSQRSLIEGNAYKCRFTLNENFIILRMTLFGRDAILHGICCCSFFFFNFTRAMCTLRFSQWIFGNVFLARKKMFASVFHHNFEVYIQRDECTQFGCKCKRAKCATRCSFLLSSYGRALVQRITCSVFGKWTHTCDAESQD